MIKIGDDPAISSGVIALFLVLAPWPSQESDRAELWSVRSSDLGLE
jgi:hypothetical protein